MHNLLHDGPTEEVEFLRQEELLLHRIDEGNEMFLVDAVVSSLVPYREQLVLCAYGIDDDLIDKTAHIARTASTRSIDVVAHIVGVPDAPVVAESEVKVPDGSGVDGVVHAMLVHEDAPIGVDVAREFSHQEMAEEGVQYAIISQRQSTGCP